MRKTALFFWLSMACSNGTADRPAVGDTKAAGPPAPESAPDQPAVGHAKAIETPTASAMPAGPPARPSKSPARHPKERAARPAEVGAEAPRAPQPPSPPAGDTVRIFISSSPRNALVFVDGKQLSQVTPATAHLPKSLSEVTVRVHKDGYDDAEKKLVPDRSHAINFRLHETGVATLSIRTAPSDARIFVAGNALPQVSPVKVKVPQGLDPVEVRAEKEGYPTETKLVIPDRDRFVWIYLRKP